MSEDASSPEPITLAEAKLNLRVDTADDDVRISSLIIVAREYVEGYTGLVLKPGTVTETAARLGRSISIAAWPVVSVDAIRAPGPDGTLSLLPDSAYRYSVTSRPVRVLPLSAGWGVSSDWSYDRCRDRLSLPVEIDITAGFAPPADVPERVKQAMHLLITHWYVNRSAVEVGRSVTATELPIGIELLLSKFRDDLA